MSRRFGIVNKTCAASNAHATEWANSERPDSDGLARCPVCGKRVLLGKHGLIPRHNRAIGKALSTKEPKP